MNFQTDCFYPFAFNVPVQFRQHASTYASASFSSINPYKWNIGLMFFMISVECHKRINLFVIQYKEFGTLGKFDCIPLNINLLR
nr:hypothetical protein [Bacteroides congonensis]